MNELDAATDFHDWSQRLPKTEREIAGLIHGQPQRLLSIAHNAPSGLSERVQDAIGKVKEQPTASRLEALGRELTRQRDEEESAALMVLLNQ